MFDISSLLDKKKFYPTNSNTEKINDSTREFIKLFGINPDSYNKFYQGNKFTIDEIKVILHKNGIKYNWIGLKLLLSGTLFFDATYYSGYKFRKLSNLNGEIKYQLYWSEKGF